MWICAGCCLFFFIMLIWSVKKEEGISVCISILGLLISYASLLLCFFIKFDTIERKYPASEYTLRYEINSTDESMDTTYVLIKIKGE